MEENRSLLSMHNKIRGPDNECYEQQLLYLNEDGTVTVERIDIAGNAMGIKLTRIEMDIIARAYKR